MTSYLSENEAENLQNGDVHLAKFVTLKWNISRTIWRIEVGDGSFFCICHALFHLSLIFSRPEVPFKDLKNDRKMVQMSDSINQN